MKRARRAGTRSHLRRFAIAAAAGLALVGCLPGVLPADGKSEGDTSSHFDPEQAFRKRAAELDRLKEQTGVEDAEVSYRQKVLDLESERRRRAGEELEALRRQRQGLEARIEYARRTVLRSFQIYDSGLMQRPAASDPRERQRRGRTSDSIPKRLQRAKKLRDAMVYRLLEFRRESGNLIAHGDALNFFLELCGPSAFAGSFYKSTAKAAKSPDEAEGSMLSGITDMYRLDEDVLRHVRYQRGLTGPRLSGRLNQDPLDTNWPAILRGPTFRRQTDDIEKRRSRVLDELRREKGKGVSTESADGLLDAVRDLLTAIQNEEESLMHQLRKDGSNRRMQTDWFRLHAAEEPVRVLLAGTYRLIEARVIEDVTLPPLDIKNGVTIEKLIAYMHENNLFFNPADANGQPAYNMIFEMLSRYYVDLSALKLETENNEKRVAQLRSEEAQVREVMLGNKLNNIQRTEIAVAQAKAISATGQAVIDARRSSESLR